MPDTLLYTNLFYEQIGMFNGYFSYVYIKLVMKVWNNDFYVCAHASRHNLVCLKEIERHKFPMQAKGETYAECKDFLYWISIALDTYDRVIILTSNQLCLRRQ